MLALKLAESDNANIPLALSGQSTHHISILKFRKSTVTVSLDTSGVALKLMPLSNTRRSNMNTIGLFVETENKYLNQKLKDVINRRSDNIITKVNTYIIGIEN